MELIDTLERIIRRYERRAPLDDGDRNAIRALPFDTIKAAPGHYLVREGTVPKVSCLMLGGYAYRHKMTADGDRQIVSLHVAGDFVDLEACLLVRADHNIQALTPVEFATVPIPAVIELIDNHPRLARAMWIDTLIDASIYREWVMNVGRRAAPERIGHVLCEFACRLDTAGLGSTRGFMFPMSQEQLADTVGLTSVHVNRTLKVLEDDRLIVRHKRFIEIPDWDRLRVFSGFDELYLHLDKVADPEQPTMMMVQ